MLNKTALCGLMPHAGTMCLIDELIEWDQERILCRTRSHLSPENPLRNNNRLSAIHAAEYGAQAVGLHGGLMAQAAGDQPQAGLLVGLRGVKLHRPYLDQTDAALTIEAHRLLADRLNLLYAFTLILDHEPVAEGRVAIIKD
jgi:predicted hotdog family 3-hydroxylacyl-ACP dehydratase